MSENNGLPLGVAGANPPEEGPRVAADEALEPREQPAAGGDDSTEPVQGDGTPDSH